MSEARRALRGAVTLGVAGVLAAGLGWLTLVAVARTQGATEYAHFAVVWSLFFAAAGVLVGLQQETTRSLVATPRGRGDTGLVGASAVAVSALLVIAALGVGFAPRVAGAGVEDIGNAAGPTLAALPLLAAAMVVNGALAAKSRWGLMAGLAVGDQVVRLAAVLLVIQVSPRDVSYGIALVAGLACFLPFIVAGWTRGPTVSGTTWGFARRSWAAMISTGCANLLVVGLPALITVTGDASDRARGVLFAAILLTRTPILLIANAVRPVIVRVFVRQRHVLGQWAWKLSPAVLIGTCAAAIAGWALGPWMLRILFGEEFRVAGGTMAGLVVAAILILLQTLSGVALVAADRDGASTSGWVLAVVTAVGCLLLPIGLEARTLSALLIAPVFGTALHLIVLASLTRRARQGGSGLNVDDDESAGRP